MSDIFLSCATEDGMTAVKLARVFRGQGWTVWWDSSTVTAGADYLKAVMEEIVSAKVSVVLWSHTARESPLVRVALGRRGLDILIPALLEKLEPPLEFYDLPIFDLSDWDGTASHAGLQSLVGHLRALMVEDRRAKPEGGGVFISYRRSDAAAYAGRLYDRLVARFGKEKVFIDMVNVGMGDDFVDTITAAAESCAVMVVLISRQWSRGEETRPGRHDYVRLEVSKGLERKIRVMPILIQGASMPEAEELPEDLAPLLRRNAFELRDTRWERDVEDLIKTLESILKG